MTSSPMGPRPRTGFAAGTLAALALGGLFYAQWAVGLGGVPGFVGNFRATFGEFGALDHALGAALFALSGGVWGAIYGRLVARPSVATGTAFAVVPTLRFWVVVAPATGKPLFLGGDPKGLALSLFFNVVVRGALLGRLCARRSLSSTAPSPHA